MLRPVHFEIHADDVMRAKDFYEKLFGWQFTKWEGSPTEYWMIITGKDEEKGINGGLLKRPGTLGSEMCTNAYVCTMDVPNFDDYAKIALDNGATVAMPKFAMPGMAYQGYFKDPEGNTFGLHEANKDAK